MDGSVVAELVYELSKVDVIKWDYASSHGTEVAAWQFSTVSTIGEPETCSSYTTVTITRKPSIDVVIVDVDGDWYSLTGETKNEALSIVDKVREFDSNKRLNKMMSVVNALKTGRAV